MNTNGQIFFNKLPYFFANPQKLIPELVQNAQRAGAMAESQNLHVTLRWELDCGGPEIRYIEEEK